MSKLKKGRVLQAAWKQICEDTDKFKKYAEHEWEEYMKSWQTQNTPGEGEDHDHEEIDPEMGGKDMTNDDTGIEITQRRETEVSS